MHQVYLSLGTNIDREHNVRSAIAALHKHFGPLTLSTLYESAAVGFEGDAFYNMVIGFCTDLGLHQVELLLDEIEQLHGRVRGAARFAPRTLDLDLLLFDDLVINEGGIHLPRDEIMRYAFVLRPLAELVPDARHPVNGEAYATLWERFDDTDQPLWRVDLELDEYTNVIKL